MLIIGFDIDGVLRELFPYSIDRFIEYKQKIDKVDITKDIVPYNEVSTYDLDPWFYNQTLKREFGKYLFENPITSYEIYSKAPIINSSFCFDILIEKLLSKLNNVHITLITNQSYSHQREATCKWLKLNHITKYDSLIFAKNKGIFNLNYLLDDFYVNCDNVNNNNGKGILYKQQYNKNDMSEYISVNNIKEYIDLIIDETKINT